MDMTVMISGHLPTGFKVFPSDWAEHLKHANTGKCGPLKGRGLRVVLLSHWKSAVGRSYKLRGAS